MQGLSVYICACVDHAKECQFLDFVSCARADLHHHLIPVLTLYVCR